MKHAILFSALLLSVNAQASGFWDSWWRNADQQGEQLLRQGKAADAARTYSDPRRKAYAELQAGNYSDAAKHLATFDDSDSNYNRGNALAQAGQLQEAIKAYDAALAQDPGNQDARHNRDLVAKALQQQQQPASKNNASPKDGSNGNNGQSGQSNDQSGNQSNSQSGNKNAGKQRNAQNNSSAQNSSGQNQSGQQQQDQAGQGKEDRNGGPKAGQGQQQSALANQSGSANQTGSSQTGSPSQSNDAAQARRDAAAALGQAPAGKAVAPAEAPVSEQQLAQEQWLRAIPDDPGGLLRRKFMIEHMIRQQGGQP